MGIKIFCHLLKNGKKGTKNYAKYYNRAVKICEKKIGKKWFNKGKVKIRDLESIHLYS